MEALFQQLEELCSIPAPSGHEQRLSTHLANKLERLGCRVDTDCLGNVSGTFPGTGTPEVSLVLFAHMDEVGLMVSKVEEDGLLRFERIGGTAEKTLRAQFVDVFPTGGVEPVPGVIGTSSHHFTPDREKHSVPPRQEMYIDIGASSRAQAAAMGVDVGSPVTYRAQFARLGPARACCKAIDNRVSVLVLLQVAEHLAKTPPASTVHIVFSVQEEFSVRGVTPVFERLKPGYAVCLDITPACDVPDLRGHSDVALGNGPAITYMNAYGKGPFGGLIPHRGLRLYLERCAAECGIPWQREAVSSLVTDAAFVQYMGPKGVCTAHLSIPVRYTHSPVEMVDLTDVAGCISLLERTAGGLDDAVW